MPLGSEAIAAQIFFGGDDGVGRPLRAGISPRAAQLGDAVSTLNDVQCGDLVKLLWRDGDGLWRVSLDLGRAGARFARLGRQRLGDRL
jgi:hypothetical protein